RDLRLQARNVTTEIGGERGGALRTKRSGWLTRLCIDREKTLTPADQQPRATIVAPPEGQTPAVVARVGQRGALPPRFPGRIPRVAVRSRGRAPRFGGTTS